MLGANIHVKWTKDFWSAVSKHLWSECVLMFLLVVGQGERALHYMILAYNKQQYHTRVASDYRERDQWI